MTGVRFEPARSLSGRLDPPPDKSISHRAMLLAAMSEGRSRIRGLLDSADTRSTLGAIESLGAKVGGDGLGLVGSGGLEITGVGLTGASPARIDVGNSGTLIRLLMGWLAGQPEKSAWVLEGDESIARRPMDRVAVPLRELGARIDCREGGFPPVEVTGAEIHGGDLDLPVASAQVKSAVLFAGLNADSRVTVTEPVRSRDHTELMLSAAGAGVAVDGTRVSIEPTSHLDPLDLDVPGDLSSAAFAIVAALLLDGSDLSLSNVGVNPTRCGLLEILSSMGAGSSVVVRNERKSSGEPVGDIEVRHSSLAGIDLDAGIVPRAIDELPLVALLGCFAEGETRVSGAGELRVKETDRISGVVSGLTGLGADIEELPDGFAVRGTGGIEGGSMDARGDHRLAMLGAVAGLVSREGVEVTGFEAVSVSYPDFESDLRSLIA